MNGIRNDLTSERQDKGERVVGDLIHTVFRNIAHRNVPASCGLQIDIVNSDPVANDDSGFLHPVDDARIDLGKLCDDGVGLGAMGNQILGSAALPPG